MSQKSYWPTLRDQGRVDKAASVDFELDTQTGLISIAQSPMSPMAVDLAGAYMRKLISGTDLVSFDNLLSAIKATFGKSSGHTAARELWTEATNKKFKFLTDNDEVTTIELDFPEEWKSSRRDNGAREKAELTIRDFTAVYFYEGFLHDKDDSRREPKRALIRSIPPVYQERMSHLAISAGLYVATIAHDIISTARPDLCPDPCQEKLILSSHRAKVTSGTATSED